MKNLLRYLFPILLAFTPFSARAQFSNEQTNVTLLGASNNLASGATLTINSGGTLNFGGSTTNQLLYVTNSSGTLAPLTLGTNLAITGGVLNASASISFANPTGTVGLSAVNGSASTAMRSDAAPALSQAIVPTWTGTHTWGRTDTSSSGNGHYDLALTPTLNQTSTAGYTDIYINRTETAVGSGQQYFESFGVGGSALFVVDHGGNVLAGNWEGSVIGSSYGGAGSVNGILKASGLGVVSQASNVTDYTPGVMTTNGDMIYFSGGIATRLPIGGASYILQSVSGFPAWVSISAVGGNVSTSGVITTGYTAQWASATTISAVANTGSGNYVLATSPTLGGSVVTIQNGLSVGGTAYSYGAPSTTGAAAILVPSNTYTVTGSSTTANFSANYLGQPTFTDSSSGTITNAATLWIAGPAQSAGSLTITNPYSLYVVSGAVNLGSGALSSSGTVTFSGGGNAVNISGGNLVVAGVETLTGTLTMGAAIIGEKVALTESGGATTVTWTAGQIYTLTLNANNTISFSGAAAGETITIELTNTASNYTQAWPTIKWPGGVTPVLSTGAHTDIFTIFYDGTNYFGNATQNF